MSRLGEMLANAAKVTDGRASVEISSAWSQGRATYGGLGAALAVRTMRECAPTDRHLRSMVLSFAAPIPFGTIDIETETIRSGKSATTIAARLKSGDQTATMIQAAFGAARDEKAVEGQTAPNMPAMDSKLISTPEDAPFLPEFIKRLEIKWVGTGIPMTGSNDQQFQAFVRLRNSNDVAPLEQLITLADMPPPVMLSHYQNPVNAASMTWALDIVASPADHISEWLYLDYRLNAASEGYSQQSGRIYSSTGKLLAISHQCMAYFGK